MHSAALFSKCVFLYFILIVYYTSFGYTIHSDNIRFFCLPEKPRNQQKLCLLLRKTNITPLHASGSDQFQLRFGGTGCSFSEKLRSNVLAPSISPGDTLSTVTEQPAGSQNSDSHTRANFTPLLGWKCPICVLIFTKPHFSLPWSALEDQSPNTNVPCVRFIKGDVYTGYISVI